jgi:hypothetical protein
MKSNRQQAHSLSMAAVAAGTLCATAIALPVQTTTIIAAPGAGTGDGRDAPGASTSIHQGTFPYAINTAGAITGYDLDSGSVFHGFIRTL